MNIPTGSIHGNERKAGFVLAGIVLIGLVITPLVADLPYLLRILTFTFIWVGVSSSWNLFSGFSGYFSFGHSAFFGIGAFTSTILLIEYDISPWIGMGVGAILAVIASVILGVILFRRGLSGLYFGLALLMIPLIAIPVLIWQGFGELSIPYTPNRQFYMAYSGSTEFYYIALVMAIIATIVAWRVRRRRLGFYLRAINNSEDAAKSLGVLTFRYKLVAFAISALLTSLFGTIFVQATYVFTVDSTFGLAVSVQPVVFSIVGGIGTIAGPVIAAMIISPITQLLSAEFGAVIPGIRDIVFAVLLIAATLFFPDGLYTDVRDWFLNKTDDSEEKES